ncbi:hypothetical protein [Nocardia stercoris]|uniref:Secreted protein n=1 Tax=Nocardia stercoris TaxID=2483361 RepID=A0A3M2L401_9NOCA|nr:hypothetical protein [Nocardia stercoris]RMI31706.1 hypothetical protein EBN03_15985 [Nocardia stercoris]
MSARTSTSILGLALAGCTAAAVAFAGSAAADPTAGTPLVATADAAAPADTAGTGDCTPGPTINTGSAGIDGSAAFFLSPASGFGANAGCTAAGAFLAALWNALGSGSATSLSGTVSSNLNPGSAETALGALSAQLNPGSAATVLGTLSANLNPGSAATILGSLSSIGWTNVSTGSVADLVKAAGAGSVAAGTGVTGSAGLIPGSVIPVPVP